MRKFQEQFDKATGTKSDDAEETADELSEAFENAARRIVDEKIKDLKTKIGR